MNKVRLGNSELYVSKLALGCINFGTTTKENTAFSILDAYIDNGGNFLDTANNYAIWNGGNGKESELTIGKWIKSHGNRKEYILATKLGAYPKNIIDSSTMQGLSRKVILEEVEKSLTNLNTDYLDLLYLHVDDYNTPQEETLETLNELIKKGIIKEIGCSNFRTWRVESLRNICEKYDYRFFCAIQQRFSYLNPTMDANLYPQIAADNELKEYIQFYKDLTMVAHTPLLYGLYNNLEITQEEYDTLTNRKKLQKLHYEDKPIPWVLKYITEQFGGSVAVFTTSSIEHLVENMTYVS